MDAERIERSKGRPRKDAPNLPTFPGPSFDEVLSMTDEQVASAFQVLQIEPAPLHWSDDPMTNYMAWNDDPLDEPNPNANNAILDRLHARALTNYAVSTRCELFNTLLLEWIKALPHHTLLKLLKAKTKEEIKESTVRYSFVSDFQRQLTAILYAEAVEASSTYPKRPQTDKSSHKGGRAKRTMN